MLMHIIYIKCHDYKTKYSNKIPYYSEMNSEVFFMSHYKINEKQRLFIFSSKNY